MDHNNIGIIGYGVVGRGMGQVFPTARIVDPYILPDQLHDIWKDNTGLDHPGECTYKVAFVCVPTEMGPDGSADTSVVRQAILDNEANVFVIKSTVPPGTTDVLQQETGRAVIFSPEFAGATPHSRQVDDGFVILGGRRSDMVDVVEAYKECKPASFRILKTTATTAELVKYAENAFLATKVTFFNEFYRICQHEGVDVDVFREALLLDPRIGREHTFTYREHPYWESHCLDKDLPALVEWARAHGARTPLIEAMIAVNELHKKDHV